MDEKHRRSQDEGNGFDPLNPFMRSDPELLSRLMEPVFSANVAWPELSSRFFLNAAESGKEVLNFVGRRLQKDADFFDELRRARSPQAAMNSYSKFVQRAATDYQKEFTGMARLSTKAADGAAHAVRSASDRLAVRAD